MRTGSGSIRIRSWSAARAQAADWRLQYIENLKAAGVPAEADVYHSDVHAFDLLHPEDELSREAVQRFNEHFEYALTHYFCD